LSDNFFALTHQSEISLHLTHKCRQKSRWLAAGWAIVIFLLSVAPSEQLPDIDWAAAPDKWAHALVYGILAMLIYCSTGHKWAAPGLSTAYGIIMEVVQYAFFPGRYFEIWDALANFIGAIAATWIMYKFFNS